MNQTLGNGFSNAGSRAIPTRNSNGLHIQSTLANNTMYGASLAQSRQHLMTDQKVTAAKKGILETSIDALP